MDQEASTNLWQLISISADLKENLKVTSQNVDCKKSFEMSYANVWG